MQGACAAPLPRGRGITPAPILRWGRTEKQTCFCTKLEERKGAHGRYENEKRAVERMNSLTASFYRFPRMQSIRSAAYTPPSPCAGGSATSSPQYFNLLFQIGICVLHTPAGNCSFCTPTTSAAGSRVNDPGGVQGQRPARFPKPQRTHISCTEVSLAGASS